jgi:hypothetical protein
MAMCSLKMLFQDFAPRRAERLIDACQNMHVWGFPLCHTSHSTWCSDEVIDSYPPERSRIST